MFRKPNSGDPLRISAAEYGSFIDAAVGHRQPNATIRRNGQARPLSGSVVQVMNDGDELIDRYHAAKITGTVMTRTDANEQKFLLRIILTVETTTDDTGGDWCVLQQPLRPNEVGEAVIDGITFCRVNIENTDDQFVGVIDDTGIPQSSAAGAARIIAREQMTIESSSSDDVATGEQWAVIRMGDACPEIVTVKISSNATGAGVYNGKILTAATTALNPAADVSASSFGTIPADENCYVINMNEVGTGTHDLTSGTPNVTVFTGRLRNVGATDGKPVVIINGIDWEICTTAASSSSGI